MMWKTLPIHVMIAFDGLFWVIELYAAPIFWTSSWLQ